MSLLRTAYNWVRKALDLKDPEPWRKLLGTGSYTGKAVNDVSAMQTSTVWGCVRILAESVGCLPWAVYEKDANGNARKVDHPLAEVLVDTPNADMTDVEFKEAKVVNLALQGNGYAYKNVNGAGNVSSLYPIAAGSIEPQRNKGTGEIEYKVLDRGRWEVVPRDKIWHTRGFGSNGLMGFSPIGYMRQAIGLSLATEEFGARFFGQGATTAAVVTVPTWLKKEQRKEAREILSEKYEGLGNAHKFMLLEGGMDVKSVQMPLEDAQFLQLRGFQVDEICRIYRVPPHMVAKLDRATFSNIEEMSIEFVMYTLAPYLVRLERSAQRWLLKPAERSKFMVRFNLDGLLRGDAETRAKFYAAMLQNGVYSRNEVRALENRNRIEGNGMDDYTVQSNMISVDDLSAMLATKNAGGPAKGAQ